jgi:hypothetical protein
MGVRTGDRVDVCRAVCRAVVGVCKDVRKDDYKTSILVLRVSEALELRIGL